MLLSVQAGGYGRRERARAGHGRAIELVAHIEAIKYWARNYYLLWVA